MRKRSRDATAALSTSSACFLPLGKLSAERVAYRALFATGLAWATAEMCPCAHAVYPDLPRPHTHAERNMKNARVRMHEFTAKEIYRQTSIPCGCSQSLCCHVY